MTPALETTVGRILIVDDVEANRQLLERQLRRQGHETVSAGDGAAALEVLRADATIDLVLLDMMMPVLDGFGALSAIKDDPALRHLPVIMISALDEAQQVLRCIERGADDYLPKPYDATLLRARIRAGLARKRLRDLEAEYARAIAAAHARVQADLGVASRYVRSILPPPGPTRGVTVDWRLIPSDELGGDTFGYHWIDDAHFAMYILDVCGHGVGAALLSVSEINVLRQGSLQSVDPRDPGAVLTALNAAFPMERHGEMFSTVWYGVWHPASRTLRYASAGHPASLLVSGAGQPVRAFGDPGMVLGGMDDTVYHTGEAVIPDAARLLLLSDGAFEIIRPDGTLWPEEAFRDVVAALGRPGAPDLDALVATIREVRGPFPLDDDLSLAVFEL
jgi:sigma-B regulation protein RsbU (phosphoserine phosphatase)